MPLANNALVLVTDGRKTLFFRNHGDQNQIDLRTEAFDEREDLPNSELKTDAAGSNGQSGGFGRPAYEETDFHQQEEDRWAQAAAEAVNKRVLRNNFDAAGDHRPAQDARPDPQEASQGGRAAPCLCEIPKEMTGRPIPDIEALIVGETRAEAPAAF